jgi:hypothetical protein
MSIAIECLLVHSSRALMTINMGFVLARVVVYWADIEKTIGKLTPLSEGHLQSIVWCQGWKWIADK